MAPLLFLLVLLGVFIVFGVGLLLQERRPAEVAIIYSVEDAIEYVWNGLAADTRESIGRSDVRRILEWEMHYLQRPDHRDGPAVVGGIDAAAFAQERAIEQGYGYEPAIIFEVLDLQAAYLDEIGAVGETAE